MIKTMIVLIVLMSLVSCGKSTNDSSAQKEEFSDAFESNTFNTKIKMLNFEPHEEDKINEAASLIRQVLLSEQFKEAILGHEFKGRKAFSDNLGLSNKQIYQRILKGSEKLSPGNDYEIDVSLVAYYEESITVGYTFPNTEKIWMNRKFFGRYSPPEVTTNLIHEWLHKLGFDHDTSPTTERRYSVPYAVGYIVGKLAKDQ